MAPADPEVYLFTVCFVGLGGSLLGLFGLLASSRRGGRAVVAGRLALLLMLGGLAAGAWALGQPRGVWLPPALLGGVCGTFWLLRSPRTRGALAAPLGALCRPRVQWGTLLLASPLLAAWLSREAVDDMAPPSLGQEFLVPDAVAVKEAPGHAVTDGGRPVKLYEFAAENAAPGELFAFEAGLIGDRGIREHVLRAAPADERYNCHGWVFAGGRYWIKGDDVEGIVRDNGYQLVSEPHEDDLVIYRDDNGHIIHSGVVRAASHNGLLLIESKWGRAGRFIHPPEVQCYGGACEFYRVARPGHTLRGLDQAATASRLVARGA